MILQCAVRHTKLFSCVSYALSAKNSLLCGLDGRFSLGGATFRLAPWHFHVRSFFETAKEVLNTLLFITTHANNPAVCESYCPTVHPATVASSMLQLLVRV